ncbi:MAG: hypothetical protein ACREBI_05155 [Nitrosotalea sp.]
MNKNKKIIIIPVILITALTFSMLPILSEKVAAVNSSVHLSVKEINELPQGEKFASLSAQSLVNLPTILNGMEEANKVASSLNVQEEGNYLSTSYAKPPDSYTTRLSPDEAKLALSTLGFHDIKRSGDITAIIHGTIVEYNKKYYEILIMGI